MITFIKKIYHQVIRKYFGSPRLFNAIKARKQSFITIVPRPKFAKDFFRHSDDASKHTPFAIVIQGKSVLVDSFTAETVKIYQKSFVGSIIIVTTHEGADSPECLKELQDLGVNLVVIPKPANPGPFNINLQITSSVAGLKEAKRLGFQYAIKTRTDIRLYGVNISEYLFNLLRQFPVVSGTKQQERIISTNIFTLKYRPYSLSDMTVAGNVDDLLLYFDIPLDNRKVINLPTNSLVDDFVRERPGELYLETEFLKKIGYHPTGTLEDSWQIFADHFIVIDHDSLDSYWYKNDIYQCLENKFRIYTPEFGLHDLCFRDWFNLYCKFCKNKNGS